MLKLTWNKLINALEVLLIVQQIEPFCKVTPRHQIKMVMWINFCDF